jgi:hypothetical protein
MSTRGVRSGMLTHAGKTRKLPLLCKHNVGAQVH